MRSKSTSVPLCLKRPFAARGTWATVGCAGVLSLVACSQFPTGAGRPTSRPQLVAQVGPHLPECIVIENGEQLFRKSCHFQPEGVALLPGEGVPADREITFDFMRLRGDFAETAYHHGRMLAAQIADGPVAYVTRTKEEFLSSLPPLQEGLYRSITDCVFNRMLNSAEPEFVATHKSLARGMRDAGITSYSDDEILEMSLSTEIAVTLSGFQRKYRRQPVAALAEIVSMCGTHLIGTALNELMLKVDLAAPYLRMGCTGFAAAGPDVEGGGLWMARNLDGSAQGYFEKHPIVILHEPPGLRRYVGVAGAGLHYVGGNAGFNDAGIGVTLHEMETERYRTRVPQGTGLSAVYLQNRILERATSIDEAWEIVRRTGNYTAWTIVVGDAKTNEIATFEFSGQKMVMAKRIKNGYHGQSNHFQAASMADQFYNYSYNKVLESRFRLQRIESLLAGREGPIGPQWILNVLSDHTDAHEGLRSFGRNLIKTNTMFTQIFHPLSGTMITSVGDRFPVGQGRFLAFQVDFSAAAAAEDPFRLLNIMHATQEVHAQLPQWTRSLSSYVAAYQEYKRGAGKEASLEHVSELLETSLRLAELDGVVEFPYAYVLAKVELKRAALTGRFEHIERSRELFDLLMRTFVSASVDRTTGGVRHLHPYDEALLRVWSARATQVAAAWGLDVDAGRLRSDLAHARTLVLGIIESERQDLELRQFMDGFWDSFWGMPKAYTAEDAAVLSIDFVTVE
jgi:predicted choloylglycine hydrolase